jgi:imidazolonepropionase-like amidohydrolase
MDAHIHFFQSGGLYTRPDVADFRHIRSYKKEQIRIKQRIPDYLRYYLLNGVTSVVDVGGPMSNFRIRDSLSQNTLSPNIFLTGPLISTYQPKAFQIDDPPIIKAHSKEEARKLVRKQLPHNPDFIKIWYIVTKDQSAKANLPIIKAVIDESHKQDLQVAVHAMELKTAQLAIEAGADLLVHSVTDQVVDDDFLTLLKEEAVDYIPTLQVMNNYERTFHQQLNFTSHELNTSEPYSLGTLFDLQHIDSHHRPSWLNKSLAEQAEIRGRADSIMAVNLRRVHDKGINVVTGTDAGNIGTPHGGAYFQELALMRKAGLNNREILQASTVNGAKLLEATSKTGTIEEGKLADMLVLNGNPLDSLEYIKDRAYIIKTGEVIKPSGLKVSTPKAMAQKQLNAYNAHNLKAFLNCYSDSVKVYNFPDHLQYTGIDKMRKTYKRFFKQMPNVHCKLANRITLGNYVIDRERIAGLPNGKIMNATAIYEVKDGKICKVWFMNEGK